MPLKLICVRVLVIFLCRCLTIVTANRAGGEKNGLIVGLLAGILGDAAIGLNDAYITGSAALSWLSHRRVTLWTHQLRRKLFLPRHQRGLLVTARLCSFIADNDLMGVGD